MYLYFPDRLLRNVMQGTSCVIEKELLTCYISRCAPRHYHHPQMVIQMKKCYLLVLLTENEEYLQSKVRS